MPSPRLNIIAGLTIAGMLALAVTAAAQNEFDREASARRYVQFLVLQLDQWTRSFPHDYHVALMSPPVDAAKLPETAKSGADDLRDSITRLGTMSSAGDVLTNAEFREQVARTMEIAAHVNQAMGAQRFPAALQSDWDQVRAELNNLARTYKVDTLAVLEPPAAGRRPKQVAAAAPAGEGPGLSGYIVDQQCAARGKGMWTNAACVARCIREGDKVVLVTEEGKVYQIANPDKVDVDAYGQKITLVGKINQDTITVVSLQN